MKKAQKKKVKKVIKSLKKSIKGSCWTSKDFAGCDKKKV